MPLKRGTKAQFDKAFTPVAIQIGRLARLWNALHENMGIIFAAIVSQGNPNIPLAVWHSTISDKSQREMLRAANRAWINFNKKLHNKTSEEITWILNESDILSNKRNEAMHTPLNILMDTESF